jgi:hypothetical protein
VTHDFDEGHRRIEANGELERISRKWQY